MWVCESSSGNGGLVHFDHMVLSQMLLPPACVFNCFLASTPAKRTCFRQDV